MNSSMIRSTSKFCKNQKCYRDFQSRSSLLEIRNISNNHSLLTGFFVIFWISSFCYFLNALYQNHQRIGLLVGGTVGRMLVKNFSHLLKVLVGIFVITVSPVWLSCKFGRSNFICWLLFLMSEFLLLIGIPLCLYRGIYCQFTFIQSAIICMISLSHFMKLHSFRVEMTQHFNPDDQLNEDEDKNIERDNQDVKDDSLNEKSQLFRIFMNYYFSPTFCFQFNYPKCQQFRFFFFVEKLFMFLGCCFLAYVLIEHFIVPVCVERIRIRFLDSLLQLIMPMFFVNLLMFFGLFEGLCNALAECTLFADREFYSDWWNCTNYGDFNRKWNKIVHAFLFRYVYRPLRSDWKLPKWASLFGTFLVSSVMHELVMGAFSGKMNFRFFAFQMSQIPLMALSAIPISPFQGTIGNVILLGGLFVGPPLLLLLYLD